jgi:hypothetical protein|uniref:Helicase ATP-binding domain-containing protein n=1 Tax=viral metagenome TaxID=1070528 RepID=A0A6C0IYQ4_9ZZZZ
MYKPLPSDITDIIKRKEFIGLKGAVSSISGDELELQSHQLELPILLNPHSPRKRHLAKYGTGYGKTIGAIAVALTYIKLGLPVYVISFSRPRFESDLLKYPELGYVTHEEVAKRKQLYRLAHFNKGRYIGEFKRYDSSLRRKITGFKFMGYRVFAQRVFGVVGDLTDNDFTNVNFQLIEQMRHSLVICDEIHNMYNAHQPNSWGKAIQFVLNVLGKDVTALFLSATPLSNSSEILDLISLLMIKGEDIGELKKLIWDKPARIQIPIINKIIGFDHSEYMTGDGIIEDKYILDTMKGRLSFITTIDDPTYPTKSFHGTSIDGVKYLKFVKTKMSEIQKKLYTDFSKGKKVLREQYAVDMMFPLPDDINESMTINDFLRTPGAKEWGTEHDILITQKKDHRVMTGPFLLKENVKQYSSKYYQLLEDILTTDGKVMVYHELVGTTGVMLLQELLRVNGIINESEPPKNNTICFHCRKIRDDHNLHLKKDDPGCHFKPMRSMIYHGEMSVRAKTNALNDFNSPINAYGEHFRILIASQAMRESNQAMGVQWLLITHRPVTIPALLQVFGRVIRTNSHIHLPKDKRHVNIKIYITDGTVESNGYRDKMKDYYIIQHYDELMNSIAVDAHIFEMAKKIKKDSIYALKFDSDGKPLTEKDFDDPDDSTFRAFEYYRMEHKTAKRLIMFAFQTRSVWKFCDLCEYIRTLDGIPNPRTFTDGCIAFVIKQLGLDIVDNYIMSDGSDIESFIRTKIDKEIIIDIDSDMVDFMVFTEKIKKLKSNSLVDVIGIIEEYTKKEHYQILRHAVENQVKLIWWFYEHVTKLITTDTEMTFISAKLSDTTGKAFVGFLFENAIHYYINDKWNTLSYTRTEPDNGIVIASYDNDMKMKIRRIDAKSDTVDVERDRRFDMRGAICETRTKESLKEILSELRVSTKKTTVSVICGLIKHELLRREESHQGGFLWVNIL